MTGLRIVLIAALVLPGIGCMTTVPSEPASLTSSLIYGIMPISSEYAPLIGISERPNAVLPESAITTIGEMAYVVSLEDFLNENPPGSLLFRAKMLHEQEHSKRQLDAGTLWWISRYVVDTDFMWIEEQRGWYLELTTLQRGGKTINVDAVAAILSDYRNVSGARMVGFNEARGWTIDVLTGRWHP